MDLDIACVACVDGVASFYCKTCDVHFCKRCEEIHFRGIDTVLHEITALFEEDELMLKSRSPFCPRHPDLTLTCFCEINQEPICSSCAFEPEHTIAHDCAKVTLQKEEARQRELLAPGLLYFHKVQNTLEDLKRSFRDQLKEDKDFISSCQAVLKEGDADKEFLSTQSTYLEDNVVLDIAKLDLLMVHIKRFVDDFNSIKDRYGYGFIIASKKLHLDSLIQEIRSQETQLPPIRKLNALTWPKYLKLKFRNRGLQMTIKPNRDYSQINQQQPILQFGSEENGNRLLNCRYCIAISPNGGDVFVIDYWNHRIQAFDQKGNFLFQFGAEGTGSGQFQYPRGIVFDPRKNRLFVSDSQNHRIQYFDLRGNFLGTFGSMGDKDSQFYDSAGIAIDDDDGNIYVVDQYNHLVQVFDENMKFLRKFGKKGNGNGELSRPWGIGILSNGQIVVSEYNGERLSVFDKKDGKFVKHIGSAQLSCPCHLFVDGKDNILVADEGNERIAIFSIEGKLIRSIETGYPVMGITMNQEGKLFTCGKPIQISVY